MKRTKEQSAAYATYHKALKAGIITRQPCEICGKPAIGHHDDLLGKPLEIKWLCRAHHVLRHVELGWGMGFSSAILRRT